MIWELMHIDIQSKVDDSGLMTLKQLQITNTKWFYGI